MELVGGDGNGCVSVAVLVWTRAASRFHELCRQLSRGSFDFQQVRSLEPNRLDPNANIKNILMIVGVLFAVSYVEEFGLNWMRWLFPPAFCICVMLGVVATFATFLSMRSWCMQVTVVSVLLVLLALAGMLEYEVEIYDLHHLYPSAYQQLRRRLSLRESPPITKSGVVSLENFQRGTSPWASEESFKAREKLLDNWAGSFPKPIRRGRGLREADPGRGHHQRRCPARGHLDRDRAGSP